MDTWINGYNTPLVDDQSIYNTTGKIADGVTTLSFVRKRNTNDERDIQFTDDKCFFFQFPVRGGSFHAVNKKIKRHDQVPTVSAERICIKSCDFGECCNSFLNFPVEQKLNISINYFTLRKTNRNKIWLLQKMKSCPLSLQFRSCFTISKSSSLTLERTLELLPQDLPTSKLCPTKWGLALRAF